MAVRWGTALREGLQIGGSGRVEARAVRRKGRPGAVLRGQAGTQFYRGPQSHFKDWVFNSEWMESKPMT